MPKWCIWIIGLLALGAASCRSSDAPATPEQSPGIPAQAPATDPAPGFADIDPGLDALRARFQEDDGMVRVIMLVAPT